MVNTRLALVGSREKTHAGGLQAGSAPCIDIHEQVVVEERHCREGITVGGGKEEERGHLFGVCLSSASVSSSTGKPSAGHGALPKKGQGGGSLFQVLTLVGNRMERW
jgi:hypothetical protein